MPTLTIMTGDQAGTSFELAKRTLSVGRDPSRYIQVIDSKVSRKHAVVRMGDAGHMISSAQSKNGLLINGEEIAEETRLADGDEVMLGDTVLRYRVDTGSDYTNAVHHRKIADRDARDANTMM